jgi:hypothetical protein
LKFNLSLTWLFVLAFIAAVCFAVWDWKRTLISVVVLVLVTIIPSTILYLVAFSFAFIKYWSPRKAHYAAWDIAKHLFTEIFDKVNGQV